MNPTLWLIFYYSTPVGGNPAFPGLLLPIKAIQQKDVIFSLVHVVWLTFLSRTEHLEGVMSNLREDLASDLGLLGISRKKK